MGAPSRILLVQLRQLGDVLLTSALLEDLRVAFPAARIDFLTSPRAVPLLDGNPWPTDVIVPDERGRLRAMRQIRARRYDWVIDTQSSPASGPLTFFSGARRRVGWDISGPWRFAYNERIPRKSGAPLYVVRARQQFLERLGVTPVARRPKLYLTGSERATGAADLRALGIPGGRPAIGLLLSAGSPFSRWPLERFGQLAALLQQEGAAPVILETPGDEDDAARVADLAPGVVRLAAPGLRRFLGVLAGLRLLVSGDTGPAHMATALDIPTVTLYGPSRAENWNPGLATTVAVSSPRLRCDACARGLRRTQRHTCMVEIEVRAVADAVRRLLATTQ